MSDANPLPDYLDDAADEELVFDGPQATDAIVDTARPRRPARRGRKSVEGAASIEAGSEHPAHPSSVEAAPADTAEEPAGEPTVPFPPREAKPAGSKLHPLLLAIVGLALLTSVMSLGGLIAVSRTLALAGKDRQAAADERDVLARVPAVVARLDAASAKLDAATGRLAAASPSGPPATIADMRHELDVLKLELAQHQPDGVSALNGTTQAGFSELFAKMDRLQAQLGNRPAAPDPRTRATRADE